MNNAAYWIEKLKLTKHPEGGHYKETYRSKEIINQSALPSEFTGNRNISTAIFFLLESGEFSAFHRIKSDEIWHYHQGSTLEIVEIKPSGEIIYHKLGINPDAGESLQVVIEAGSWFAAHVIAKDTYTLCGCTVAPGFDFTDFKLSNKEELSIEYPQHRKIIDKLSR